METERAPNRVFWVFVGMLAAGGVVLTALIVWNRPMLREGAAAVAEGSLRRAADAARRVQTEQGSFAAADARRLRLEEPDLLFIDPDQASNDPEIVSVGATPSLWSAGARADTGGCYWIRLRATGEEERGTGTDCSAEQIAVAVATGWPVGDASPTAPATVPS